MNAINICDIHEKCINGHRNSLWLMVVKTIHKEKLTLKLAKTRGIRETEGEMWNIYTGAQMPGALTDVVGFGLNGLKKDMRNEVKILSTVTLK